MISLTRRYLYISIALAVPLLSLISPHWISINSLRPNWAVLWLLPWSIHEGPWNGMFAGFCLGMLMDASYLEGPTQLPALIALGFFWGQIGQASKTKLADKIFSLGLLSWIGAFASGLSIWCQQLLLFPKNIPFFFHDWAFQVIFAQALITSLLSPVIVSLTNKYFFNTKK